MRDEEEVVFRAAAFGQITKAIEGIASALYEPLKKLKPTKASIEFGLQAGVDAGELIAILVKCDGSANLKIKLEWSERDACKDPKMP